MYIDFIEHDLKLDPIILEEKIFVYRDVVPDIENLYRIMKESERDAEGRYYLHKWDKWAMFGTYSQKKWMLEDQENSELGPRFDEEKYFSETIDRIYNIVLGDYVKKTNWELPDTAGFSGCSFCKYDVGLDILKNKMTMQYHTDYVIPQRDMPGRKYLITCTMYINDDYEGGEIEFWIDGKIITWKPKAGDVVIFPSGEPYWHGVKTIASKEKFFVRNFVMYDYDGSPEWLANKDKYGEEKWAEMEKERMEYESPRVMLYIDEETKERISYEEVLARRHSNN